MFLNKFVCFVVLISCCFITTSCNSKEINTFLIVDLAGDGFDLLPLSESQVYFDVDGDKLAERTAWVKPEEGFIFMYSRDENLQMDTIYKRLVSFPNNLLSKFKKYDTNDDKKYDENDFFKYGKQKPYQTLSVRIVQDKDLNGIFETDKKQRNLCDFVSFVSPRDGKDGVLNCKDGQSYKVRKVEFEYEDSNQRWNALCETILKKSVKKTDDPFYLEQCK